MIGNIYITGQIGDFDDVSGVKLMDVIGQVKSQPDAIGFNVYINSEGGVVNDGTQIYDYLVSLKETGKTVKTIAVGKCDSVATKIFMAGDVRVFSGTPEFMIHVPWGNVTGNADTIAEYHTAIAKEEKTFIDFYASVLNMERPAIEALLKNETYLTPEQAKSLGFITEEPVPVLAKALIKTDYMNGLTEKDKNWFEGMFSKILGKSKPVVAKKVQDATGAELDFTALADGDAITEGATATVAGAPAEGDYTLPDGVIYTFEGGVLITITQPANAEMAAKDARIAELEQELSASKAVAAAKEVEVETMKVDVLALKQKVTSVFSVDTKKVAKKKDDPADPDDRTAGMKEYLNSKR